MIKTDIGEANALYQAGQFAEALKRYEAIAQRPGWGSLVRANIALCREKLQPGAENAAAIQAIAATMPAQAPRIIITMTTIRSRLPLVPRVIESLLQQTLAPVRIDLNISREPHLLDEGISREDPVIVELGKIAALRINWVENIGPYRKIWAILQDHFSGGGEQLFVTVDDDTIYPNYFLRQLYESYLRFDCVIAFRGRHIEMEQDKIAAYSAWTMGKCKPAPGNLPTGKDGVLYSTKFFTREFMNWGEAQRLAPTADDLWIKWHCGLNGVPAVILNPEACLSDYDSFPVVNYDKEYRDVSLYARHNSDRSGAENKNDVSIRGLEAYFSQAYGYNLAWVMQTGGDAWRG